MAHLQFQRFSYYHQDGEHGGMEAGVVLELRGYILTQSQQKSIVTLKEALERNLKAHPHSDTLPSTGPHRLTVPLPLWVTFFQTTTEGMEDLEDGESGVEMV